MQEKNVPIISCMGAETSWIPPGSRWPTYTNLGLPAREGNAQGTGGKGIGPKVVYSKEPVIKPMESTETGCRRNCICLRVRQENAPTEGRTGSVSFVPSVAGLIIAGEVIKDIAGIR